MFFPSFDRTSIQTPDLFFKPLHVAGKKNAKWSREKRHKSILLVRIFDKERNGKINDV